MSRITTRPIRASDRADIGRLLGQISEFREDEIACALELVDEALKSGNRGNDYAVLCAENEGDGVVGFICYGETPLTKAVYDLYWIVIDPRHQRCGIGGKLLNHLENIIRTKHGRILVAETSSLPSYGKARSFYAREGFRQESRIKDCYAPGDDRLTYCKRYG